MTTRPQQAMPDAMSAIHRLFFAVQPDLDAQAKIALSRAQLRKDLGIVGRMVADSRLHVTLHWLSDHVELPPDLVERAMAAGASVESAPFDVVFDRAGCLGGEGGLVALTASRGLASLRRFQRSLAGAMTDAGIGRYVRASFKPHVSLIYGDRKIETQAIAPIRWAVNELVLIHSVVGKGQHIVLGRWALQTRQLDLGW